jgi:hypothetical protein
LNPFLTLIFRFGFCKCLYSFTCFTLILKYGFYKSTCSFTCFTLIFQSSFYITTCGVGACLSTLCTLIFNFGFYRFFFKVVFCKKSSKLDLSSSILIGRFVVINTTSLEPKNFEQSCNCSSTLSHKDDIVKKLLQTPNLCFDFNFCVKLILH